MTVLPMPMCWVCKHRHANDGRPGYRCDAFPAGIPQGIIDGEVDHREPVAGDRGIRFLAERPGRSGGSGAQAAQD